MLDDEYEIKLIELKKPEIWIVTEESVLEEALNSEILAIREKQVEIAENDLLRAKISGIPELDLKKKELTKRQHWNWKRETEYRE